jgi:hypothetical protein
MMNALLVWLILLFGLYVAYAWGVRSAMARRMAEAAPPVVSPEKMAVMESKLAPMLAITGHRSAGDIIQFEGRLKGKTSEVFRKVQEAFAGEPVTPLLLEGEHNDVRVVLLPEKTAAPAVERPKWELHWLLFVATVATTTWAGALHAGVNLLQQPWRFAVGLPYSLGLMLLLAIRKSLAS